LQIANGQFKKPELFARGLFERSAQSTNSPTDFLSKSKAWLYKTGIDTGAAL